MDNKHTTSELVFDDLTFTLDQFSRACQRDHDWVIRHVESDLINAGKVEGTRLIFTSMDLTRARRLASIESIFETNDDAAGLVVDLIEEVERLRRQSVRH